MFFFFILILELRQTHSFHKVLIYPIFSYRYRKKTEF